MSVVLARGAIGHEVALGSGRRRNGVERVDLAVRMSDRRPDLGTPVLEHEHVRDVVTRAERLAPLGPEIDDAARAVRPERGEAGVVLRCVEHDLATIVGHRREPVDERAHVVGLGCLEAADAERALTFGEVRPRLTRPDRDRVGAREWIDQHKSSARARRSIASLSNGARNAMFT